MDSGVTQKTPKSCYESFLHIVLLVFIVCQYYPSNCEQVWNTAFYGIKNGLIINIAIFMREEITHAKNSIPGNGGIG